MSVHNKLYVKSGLFVDNVNGSNLSNAWIHLATVDQNLAKADDVEFNTLNLTSNLTVGGDLTVNGTVTVINSTELKIEDNIIVLNKGEQGSGVTSVTSGIEIARGSLDNQQLLFNENNDTWTVGVSGGAHYRLAELVDSPQTQGAIPGYDSTGRLAEAEGLTTHVVTQLQQIAPTVTISSAQWAYLSSMQQVNPTSDVTFNNVTVNGSITHSVIDDISTDSNILSSITICDTGNNPVTVTLPDNATHKGKSYTIVLKNAVNDLTIVVSGTDVIEGNSSMVLDITGQHITVCSLGNGTWIIM